MIFHPRSITLDGIFHNSKYCCVSCTGFQFTAVHSKFFVFKLVTKKESNLEPNKGNIIKEYCGISYPTGYKAPLSEFVCFLSPPMMASCSVTYIVYYNLFFAVFFYNFFIGAPEYFEPFGAHPLKNLLH